MANQDLPHVRDGLLDAGGTASRAYYLFFSGVDTNLKQAQSDIAALQQSSGGSTAPTFILAGNESVVVTGSVAAGYVELSLVNDASTVLGHYRYGSDSGGNKGWQAVASDFASTANIALSTDINGVVSFDLTDVTPGAAGTLQAVAFDAKGRVSQQHAVAVTGAVHRIIVTGGDGSGSTINVTTPQDIDTTSSPTFAAVNLATDPASALQAATKQYVDSALAGLSWKAPAVCATTANITLSGLQTIDGYTTVAGDRVLVMAQTSAQNNGIYIAATGAWQRASDMATWAQVPNASLWVEKGTVNADTAWTCTADPGGTLGTTAINFVKFGPVFVGVTSFNGRSGVVVPASGDYTFSLIGGTALATQGGTGQTTYTLGDILYSSATNTLSKLAGNTTTKKQFLSQTGTGSASTAPSWAAIVSTDIPWPSDYISGLKLIWNSATSISVGTGEAVIPSTGALESVNAPLTLSGLSLAASTFYHVYMFDNAGVPTIECVITAPAAPYQGTARAKTGDTTRRYIGSILTDASGNVQNFLHSNNDYLYISGAIRVVASGTNTTRTNVSLSTGMPITAYVCQMKAQNSATSGGSLLLDIPESGHSGLAAYTALSLGQAAYLSIPTPSQTIQYLYASAPSGGAAIIDVVGYTFER